ncbi:insulin-like growth factor 1 receptor isoform X2 [Pectinophora gossypiella]|nr:insulin-like growth factor 1 receptor isoform X2 [Pectinophora gossypiella]
MYLVQSLQKLQHLKDCVVILGNLRVLFMEKANTSSFQNISFPELREVTGFVAFYRVSGLESVGQLFPNLRRIRGSQLINNYGLILHDMPNLREVGLYNLLKIDRGGVIIWGGPHTCYVDSINWNAIAPGTRHMLTYPEMTAHCNTVKPCKCSVNKEFNYCWNSKKCQHFLSDPKLESCNPECLECRGGPDKCTLCRHYTYQGHCVPQCPPNTILLPDNQYCITIEECNYLKGWMWNNTCVFECPLYYKKVVEDGSVTCAECSNCQKTCLSLVIDSLSSIQQAYRCVYIRGSLTINVRSVPGAVKELKKYLRHIEVVHDYIMIYGSLVIKSLDFLPSLQHIGGRTLEKNSYSVIIYDMNKLQQLFPTNVMSRLAIDRGKLKMYNNPMLCVDKIYDFEKKFPVRSNEIDIPPGINGYSGGCEDLLRLKIQVLNETSAIVTFVPYDNVDVQYTILYARVPSRSHTNKPIVPETCSASEWFVIHTKESSVLLTSLRPATTYAVCIETFVYSNKSIETYVARTSMVNFTTPFTKPEPPFIQELVATSANTVGVRWVDHRDYQKHITSYQLDVTLIDIPDKDVKARDHCNVGYNIFDVKEDYSRHAVVLKPPEKYESCGQSCLTLTSLGKTAIEEHFDVCDSDLDCNNYEENPPPKNSSYGNYIKTLILDINGPKSVLHIHELAPFRDYRIRLRACAGQRCSRSTRGVIRTLRSNKADIPTAIYSSINETGDISIKWDPPEETNGPLFAYFVQILSITEEDGNLTSPDVWCFYPNDNRSLVVRLQLGEEFKIRICTSTLASYSTCSEWHSLSAPEFELNLLLASILFSIILSAVSLSIGYFYNRHMNHNDGIPLVDITSMYRSESDPPNVVMLSDFMPIYSVPLTEALLDY